MATREEISGFLDRFLAQKTQCGMVIYPREKNAQALLAIEMSATERERIIEQLGVENYYRGPRDDGIVASWQYWEFGKRVKGHELYIKLSLGLPEGAVFCYSFHPAERNISYPYA